MKTGFVSVLEGRSKTRPNSGLCFKHFYQLVILVYPSAAQRKRAVRTQHQAESSSIRFLIHSPKRKERLVSFQNESYRGEAIGSGKFKMFW